MANVPFFFEGERKIFTGAAAARTNAFAVENPGAFFQEIGGNLCESNGSVWNQISIAGAALVSIAGGSIGLPAGLHNTEIPVLPTTTATEKVLSAPVKAMVLSFVGADADSGVLNNARTALIADVEPAVAASAGLVLMGYSCRESHATVPVAAAFNLVHGATVAGGTVIHNEELAANGSNKGSFGKDGIPCPNGISIDWKEGTVDVTILYKTITEVYCDVCFAHPNTTVMADWLNVALVGPRKRMMKNQKREFVFQDIAGASVTIDRIGHKTNVAGGVLSIEVIS